MKTLCFNKKKVTSRLCSHSLILLNSFHTHLACSCHFHQLHYQGLKQIFQADLEQRKHEFERVKIQSRILLLSPFEQGAVTQDALHTWRFVVVGPGGLFNGHCLLTHVRQDDRGAVEFMDEGEDLCQLWLALGDLHHLAQQLQRGLTLDFLLGWR